MKAPSSYASGCRYHEEGVQMSEKRLNVDFIDCGSSRGADANACVFSLRDILGSINLDAM